MYTPICIASIQAEYTYPVLGMVSSFHELALQLDADPRRKPSNNVLCMSIFSIRQMRFNLKVKSTRINLFENSFSFVKGLPYNIIDAIEYSYYNF